LKKRCWCDDSNGKGVTLFYCLDGAWCGQDFDTRNDAAAHAGYGLGDCNMRLIIWDWEKMEAVSAHEGWEAA